MSPALLIALALVSEPRLNGLVIDAIRIEAAPEEDQQRILRLSGLVVGEPYSQSEVRRAVKVLFQLGRYENVYVFADRTGNAVKVQLVLPPKPYIRKIEIKESEVLSSAALNESIGWKPGDRLDARDLAVRRERVEERLRRLGYRQAAVGLALQPIGDSGAHDLIVRIDEGPTTELRRVVIRGSPRMALWRLAKRVGIETGDVVDLAVVESALASLRAEYVAQGYLDAAIEPPQVRELALIADGHPLADLVVTIDAGPDVVVRFKGNRVVPRRELEAASGVLEELGTGQSAVAEARERILARYEVRGFFRARVEPAVRTTRDGGRREVLFSIDEGRGARVGSISFPGNGLLDEKQLKQEVYQSVAQTILDDLGRPGADPETVGTFFGDRSVGRRDSPQPGNVAPDPKEIYVPRAYQAATSAIADLYQAQGYQSVEIGTPTLRERADGALVDVEIPIKPGVKWLVGAIAFSGNTQIESERLYGLLTFSLNPLIRKDVPLSFEEVIQTQRRMIEFYQDQGYLFANVTYELAPVRRRRGIDPDEARAYTSSATVADVRRACLAAQQAEQKSCEVELRFVIAEGPQVRTRDVIVKGLQETREGIVKGEMEVKDGEVLTQSDLAATRENLLRVGVFERVTVRPLDEEQVADEKDVVVELRERKTESAEFGGGLSTGDGARLFAGYGNANLWGTALRFQVNGKINYLFAPFFALYNDNVRDSVTGFYNQFNTFERLEYQISAGLAYPRIFGLPRGFSAGFDISVLRDYAPTFAENTQKATLVGNYKGYRPTLLGNKRPLTLQFRVSVERTDLQCNAFIENEEVLLCTKDATAGSDRIEGDTFYTTFGPRVTLDLRDDPLDPRGGAYFELSSDVAVGTDASSPGFVEIEGRANLFVPIGNRVVLAWILSGGKIWPFTPTDDIAIPVNRRLFADGRIRGYALRTLLPQDVELGPDGQPIANLSTGGLLFLSLQSELRIAVYGPLWLAGFVDLGDLYEDGAPSFETEIQTAAGPVTRSLAVGAGFGVRVSTPIGPLAVDLAYPVRQRDPGAEGWTVHFAVGTF